MVVLGSPGSKQTYPWISCFLEQRHNGIILVLKIGFLCIIGLGSLPCPTVARLRITTEWCNTLICCYWVLMAPDPNCNCILMPWAQPSSFPEPCEYFDPSSRVKIIAKLFSELPGSFRITDPNFLWLMATVRDWIYAPISAESMTVWKKGRCFKEILVFFPWQLDLWNSGSQNWKFSHEFCVGQKKRWSPGTSRRGVCLLERDIFQFWQLVKSPCRREWNQTMMHQGGNHTPGPGLLKYVFSFIST